MKTIKKPTQAALADALGIGPAMVTRDKRRGMPVHSIEAALAWRDANVRVRWSAESNPEGATQAMHDEQTAVKAGALLLAAGELLEVGGDVSAMVSAIRAAMAAVPPSLRDRVMVPVKVMDLLTNDVAMVLERGDPDGRIAGSMFPTKRDAIEMGMFWYCVAAGEVGLSPKS